MHEVSCMQGWRQTMAVSGEGPSKVLGPAPTCGTDSFHEVCTYPFCRPGSPVSHWSWEKLGWAVFTQGQQHQDEEPLPVKTLLLKHGGGSFSRSLMGGVSTSSNWAVLQYKMLFENQCSCVGSSSLSPLSPWPRHGAGLQALQHQGDGWQHATFTRGQSLV